MQAARARCDRKGWALYAARYAATGADRRYCISQNTAPESPKRKAGASARPFGSPDAAGLLRAPASSAPKHRRRGFCACAEALKARNNRVRNFAGDARAHEKYANTHS